MVHLAPTLDLDALEAFIRVAELRSFTRAAEALGTTQSTVSLKVKRLEESLGRRLLERTPRLVRLAEGCGAFLEASRDLLARRDVALATLAVRERRRLTVGISDQAAGRDLPSVLVELAEADPDLLLDLHIGASRDLLDRFDQGRFDAVVVRGEDDRRPGEVLLEEPYRWVASPSWRWPGGFPLPLATLAEPCGVRALAIRSLDGAGLPWRDAFVGGGVAALGAALSAGLALSVLALRVAPPDLVDVGETFGLPRLPPSRVVLHSRVADVRLSTALRRLAAAFRGKSTPPGVPRTR
ncbi:LysR family transcriptional regulator [Lichenibacterium minor]|uniref:LysR family transcriptional regulator n=1 Tax=Lichenibacterium minor TaxID=2316528 RepID=A0A4Q2U8K7_9HYPH|nr:LysR family transcriptional regulator [Lichenibacterium minor]RYC33079.1 LysR family transcriptional regulator [Lichenibacterium minor]